MPGPQLAARVCGGRWGALRCARSLCAVAVRRWTALAPSLCSPVMAHSQLIPHSPLNAPFAAACCRRGGAGVRGRAHAPAQLRVPKHLRGIATHHPGKPPSCQLASFLPATCWSSWHAGRRCGMPAAPAMLLGAGVGRQNRDLLVRTAAACHSMHHMPPARSDALHHHPCAHVQNTTGAIEGCRVALGPAIVLNYLLQVRCC